MKELIDARLYAEKVASFLLGMQEHEFGQLKNNTTYKLSLRFEYKHPFESPADIILADLILIEDEADNTSNHE